MLVLQRLLLDLGTLIHRLHRPEYTSTIRKSVEFSQHGLLDQVGQLLDDE